METETANAVEALALAQETAMVIVTVVEMIEAAVITSLPRTGPRETIATEMVARMAETVTMIEGGPADCCLVADYLNICYHTAEIAAMAREIRLDTTTAALRMRQRREAHLRHV